MGLLNCYCQLEKITKKINMSNIILGIIIMMLGTGIGTFLIQKGRVDLAFQNTTKLITHINSTDSTSRTEILSNLNVNKDEIVLLVNNQTKASALEIISEVKDRFQLVDEDLHIKGEQIAELESIEKKRKIKELKSAILKITPPKINIEDLFIENDQIFLKVSIDNIVPFKFKYSIGTNSVEISNRVMNSQIEIRPKQDDKYFKIPYTSLEFIGEIGKVDLEGETPIKVLFEYESLFYSESRKPELKGKIEKDFIFNFKEKTIK